MKKFMYLIPFAAVALASCSNESIDSQEKRVALSDAAALNIAPAVQGTTRGTVKTDANLTEFHVEAKGDAPFWTVTPAGTAIVTTTGSINYNVEPNNFEADVKLSSGKWIIGDGTKDYYWSSKGMSATFTAWAPSTFNVAQSYEVKPNIADQEDLLVAYNAGTGADFTSGVPLNFQHVMSQVIIKALNKDADKLQIEVAGVKLTNIKNTGKLTLPKASTASGTFSWESADAPSWSTESGTASYTANGTTAVASNLTTISTLTGSASQLTSEPFLLMPQTQTKADLSVTDPSNITGAYFSVLVRVTQKSDSKQIYPTLNSSSSKNAADYFAYVAIPVDIDWKPGYKYTYTLNFSSTGIGKADPNNAADQPGDGYPVGSNEGVDPGDDILDGPVKLYFTVTVEDWIDGGDSPLDM